jgi:hypothetical protein
MTEIEKIIIAFIVGGATSFTLLLLLYKVRVIRLFVVGMYHFIMNRNKFSYKESAYTGLRSLYEPIYEINKKHFIYTANDISLFLNGYKNWDQYKFYESISGVENFFSNKKILDQRTRNRCEPDNIKNVIVQSLGMEDLSFGLILKEISKTIIENENYRVESITLYYDTDAVIQYYCAKPKINNNGRVMVCLHGCSSAPDKILGIGQSDYTNDFALKAVKKGWTVIAPFILNDCNRIEVFDTLGSLTTGLTLMGYEIKKLEHIIKRYGKISKTIGIDLYGVSFGGQLAMYYSTLNNNVHNMIISGAMVFDYFKTNIDRLIERNPKQRNNTKRLGNHLAMHRYVNITDILLNYLISSKDTGKLVVEMGTYDVNELKSRNHSEALDKLQQMMIENNIPQNRLFINSFNGYHETNPTISLNVIC